MGGGGRCVHAALADIVDRDSAAMGILRATGVNHDVALRQLDAMVELADSARDYIKDVINYPSFLGMLMLFSR